MKVGLITADESKMVPFEAESILSFRPFISYLLELAKETNIRSEFYKYVSSKFAEEQALALPVDLELTGLTDLLNLIHLVINPMIYKEEEHFWALSTPDPGGIFYGTDVFYDFLSQQDPQTFDIDEIYRKKQFSFIYKLLLERFYNIPLQTENEILYADNSSGFTRYFKIHTDTRFINIECAGELPLLSNAQIEAYLLDGNDDFLSSLLPLSLFKFEGFSIISLTNVTAQQATLNIEALLTEHGHEAIRYNEIFHSLKALSATSAVEFGILPLLKVNGKAVYLSTDCTQSMIMNSAKKFGVPEETLSTLVNKYQEASSILVFDTQSAESRERHPFLSILKAAGVLSYALIPVYYRKQLTGILEIYSSSPNAFDRKLLARIQPAVPLLGQLLYYSIEDFNLTIENTIKEQFTPLKQSVQWKFNEVAWKYIQESRHSQNKPKLGTVAFEEVYPMYGAIDIRNSSIERNAAVQEDIESQLFLLLTLLNALKEVIEGDSKATLELKWQAWTNKIEGFRKSKDELTLNRFLATEVTPFLKEVRSEDTEVTNNINQYLEAVSPEHGSAYKNRRELETSFQIINSHINNYFDDAQKQLQEVYPHYFEKFRTDGIEYDLYVGQSISPGLPFDDSHLKNMRLWQLKSMAEIARMTQGLTSRMSKPLQTTQLIFIHSNPIDIAFRNDEKRFDVEGAYSIRYEIIKKRIDKVLINGTDERLTQPGMIALVYSNRYEVEEYLEYINLLQQDGLLEKEVEFLDLEQVQGVSRLKALRVKISEEMSSN